MNWSYGLEFFPASCVRRVGALGGLRRVGDGGYQLRTGNMAFQPGLRAKEQEVFEGRCVQSGNAGQELRMRKAALLPGVSLMETARDSFLRRQEGCY